MTESEKARFGASAMVRYVSGINRPIYPIAFIKYKMAIGISCCVLLFHSWQEKDTRYAGSGHDTIFWTA